MIADFIKRIAERTGYKREFFQERNMPSTPSNLVAIPWYGDVSSTFILSSLLLKSYKELHKDKYFILCSWPGYHDLFPYVDEFWYLEDESASKSLALEATSFYNASSLCTNLTRSLLEVVNVLTSKDFQTYYDNGFTKVFWEQLSVDKKIKRFLPEVPSVTKLATTFKNELGKRTGTKVFVFPVTKMRSWQKGRCVSLPVSKMFWETLLNGLLENGFIPVIYQNWHTYDMSMDFLGKCIYVVPRNVADVLAAMRAVGLVLDVHSGISRLAIAARTPFIAVDERARFMEHHDYEVDDLCCLAPRKYIFSFSTMLMSGNAEEWKDSVLDNIFATLKTFSQDDNLFGSTNESYEEISYEKIRKHKARMLGAIFLNKGFRNGKCCKSEN